MRKTRLHRHHKGVTNKNGDSDVQKLIKMYPPEVKQNQNLETDDKMLFSKRDSTFGLTKSTTVKE